MMCKNNVRILIDEWLNDYSINDGFEAEIIDDKIIITKPSSFKNSHKNQCSLKGFGEDVLM